MRRFLKRFGFNVIQIDLQVSRVVKELSTQSKFCPYFGLKCGGKLGDMIDCILLIEYKLKHFKCLLLLRLKGGLDR